MSNPLRNLKIDYWYKAVLALGAVVLILSLTIELKSIDNSIALLFSLGAIFIGFGEWINHPLQTYIFPPSAKYPGWLKGEGNLRKNSFAGVAFVVLGVVLALIGAWKLVV